MGETMNGTTFCPQCFGLGHRYINDPALDAPGDLPGVVRCLPCESTGRRDKKPGDKVSVEQALAAATAEVQSMRDGITWYTTCTGCADLLNKLYDADMRIEQLTEGRCLASITLRDEEHRQPTCILPADHTEAHDDGLGTSWTDKDHWQPSQADRDAATIAQIEDALKVVENAPEPDPDAIPVSLVTIIRAIIINGKQD